MAMNQNLQSEDVKKEVSIVKDQTESLESLVDQVSSTLMAFLGEVKELRNIIGNHEEKIGNHEEKIRNHEEKIRNHEEKIGNHEEKIGNHEEKIGNHEEKIGNHEEKIRNHEEKIGVLEEALLVPILLSSLRDEQLVKLFKKLKQASQKSHWPDVIENTRQFRRGSFSCCVGHLKAYVNQLLKNNAPKKGEVNCLGIDQSKRSELIAILNECHAEFLLDEFWTELNSSAHLNIHEKPEYKEFLEKAAKKEEDLSDNIMKLINDAFTNDNSTESETSTEPTAKSKENQNNSQEAGAMRLKLKNKRHTPY